MSAPPTGPTRRVLLAGGFATIGPAAAWAQASPGRQPTPGLVANSDQDQTALLRRRLAGAGEGGTVHLPAGRYRVGDLALPSGSRLVGAGAGRTVLVQAGQQALLSARGGGPISLHDLSLEGHPAADRRAPLVSFIDVNTVEMSGVALGNAAGTALRLERCGGRIERCSITDADVAILSLDATGLQIAGNVVDRCRNNGIQVWRSQKGYDGTQVVANRVTNVRAEAGGSGQNGNGINVYRAGAVIVAQNTLRACAFTAVRNNSGDDVQILGNSCTDLGEVAIYAEFAFDGCVIANNLVDRAALGISVSNFNEKGRLAAVTGNVVRNLFRRPNPDTGAYERGIGIAVEADTTVVGNVVESAEFAGIAIGYGPYQRDVVCANNIVRRCPYGVTVSIVPGGGTAQITNNILSECSRGKIVGFNHDTAASGDLMDRMDPRFPHITVHGNTGS